MKKEIKPVSITREQLEQAARDADGIMNYLRNLITKLEKEE